MGAGSLYTDGALVQVAVDADVSEVSVLEAGLMIAGVVLGKGCIMVTICPSDFSVGNGGFFFFGQRRQ